MKKQQDKTKHRRTRQLEVDTNLSGSYGGYTMANTMKESNGMQKLIMSSQGTPHDRIVCGSRVQTAQHKVNYK